MNISKELLIEVLGERVERAERVDDVKLSNLEYMMLDNTDLFRAKSINIHELAYKVKEWAVSQGYTTASQITMCKTAVAWIMLDNGEELIFEEATEPEAIFKAGQWILENKS